MASGSLSNIVVHHVARHVGQAEVAAAVSRGRIEIGHWPRRRGPYDAILLDLGLPGRGGLEVLAGLRGQGLLVKPFAFAELVARVRAMLRRGRPDETVRLLTIARRTGPGRPGPICGAFTAFGVR